MEDSLCVKVSECHIILPVAILWVKFVTVYMHVLILELSANNILLDTCIYAVMTVPALALKYILINFTQVL